VNQLETNIIIQKAYQFSAFMLWDILKIRTDEHTPSKFRYN